MARSTSISETWSHYNETLKTVSRSFYLSIKFLPLPMREPIALGYLLARLSDTFADTTQLEVCQRLDLLDSTMKSLRDASTPFPRLNSNIVEKIDHEGEKQLAKISSEIFQWYRECPDQDQILIEEVLTQIINGQRWDLEFFHQQEQPVAATEQQLLTYIYQVAGSVGEFWTKVGYTKLEHRFAKFEDATELIANGRALGEALQLINIIRDLHEDLPAGRQYLPTNKSHPEQLQHWLTECRSRLEQGKRYVQKVRHRRVALASVLPLLLAESTANKIETQGIDKVIHSKIKITRKEVFKRLIEASLYH